jgi:hypothetical protein
VRYPGRDHDGSIVRGASPAANREDWLSRKPAQDDVSVLVLFAKLLAQWLAAGLLTPPAEYLWALCNDPGRVQHNDFLLVSSCVAPLAALWVVWRHRRARLSFASVAGRVVGLLLVSAVVTWVAMDPAGLGVLPVDPFRIGAVLLLLWLWIPIWRLVDRRLPSREAPARLLPRQRRSPAPPRTAIRPRRGQIWSAMVPFEEGSYAQGEQRAKDRPCVVLNVDARGAYILKITSVDQGDRPGYTMLPAGWHPWSEKASWIKHKPSLWVPMADFRQYVCDTPSWAWSDLARQHPVGAASPNCAPPGHPGAPGSTRAARPSPSRRGSRAPGTVSPGPRRRS